MFTLEQIKAVHLKVKSGADFPRYIQDMKGLGVKGYEHFLTDGHVAYNGTDDSILYVEAKWPLRMVPDQASLEEVKHFLHLHQQGLSDYNTICVQLGKAGIEKWIVDMFKMTCTYFDRSGKGVLVEKIPAP